MSNDIQFYKYEVLDGKSTWSTYRASRDPSSENNPFFIQPGGYVSVDLRSDLSNGLKASKYRKLKFDLYIDTVSDQYNYDKDIVCQFKCIYKDGNARIKSDRYIPITKMDMGYNGTRYRSQREVIIDMLDYDLDSGSIKFINNTDQEITLFSISMLRSQDINSSQVGESIGWGIALNKVVGYTNGCEVFYDGTEEPIKMWWQEDSQGNFNGIDVDHERLIAFERKNEILVD